MMLSTDPKALWEELKRGASDAAGIAARKTTELTSIAKLTVSIKTNEAKLRSAFEEIGRLFYNVDRKGADYTEEIASCILRADRYEADIAEAKKQIAAIRKLAICPNCGNEIDSDVCFCPFCGTKHEKPEEPCCCCEDEAEENEGEEKKDEEPKDDAE